MISQLAFYHLDDVPNIHPTFDNNQSSSFRDYLSDENRHSDKRKRDDRQTKTGDNFFRIRGIMKRRENMTGASRPLKLMTMLP